MHRLVDMKLLVTAADNAMGPRKYVKMRCILVYYMYFSYLWASIRLGN